MSRKTIHDVAAAAGVSIKTVSRVLNDETNVRPDTRARVLAAIDALQFRPSLLARSLAGNRSQTLGFIYDDPSVHHLTDLQRGAMARCREAGNRLLVQPFVERGAELVREVVGFVTQTHLDGLIVTPPLSVLPDLAAALEERDIAHARIAPGDGATNVPTTDMDDVSAAREMTEHLLGLGHRDIAFIIGHPEHVSAHQRFMGFRLAMEAHGLLPPAGRVVQGAYSFESGVAAARKLLAARPRPTAIFASNDDMAAGVLLTAHDLGIAVPGELSVAGFDDSFIAGTLWPRLSTVHQPSFDLAYEATGQLLAFLKTGEVPPRLRVPHRLVVRASTGPVPASAIAQAERRGHSGGE